MQQMARAERRAPGPMRCLIRGRPRRLRRRFVSGSPMVSTITMTTIETRTRISASVRRRGRNRARFEGSRFPFSHAGRHHPTVETLRGCPRAVAQGARRTGRSADGCGKSAVHRMQSRPAGGGDDRRHSPVDESARVRFAGPRRQSHMCQLLPARSRGPQPGPLGVGARAAIAGLGSAVLPRLAVEADRAAGILKRLPGPVEHASDQRHPSPLDRRTDARGVLAPRHSRRASPLLDVSLEPVVEWLRIGKDLDDVLARRDASEPWLQAEVLIDVQDLVA